MKLKILLIVIIISTFTACNSNSSKEKSNVIEGTYEATETGFGSRIGIWVFSRDEITVLISHDMQSAFSNLGVVAVQKYYIKDDVIYTCTCNSMDCLSKEKNYDKIWKIESISQTKTKKTVMLTTFDNSIKVKLEKDKSLGLDVKDWE